MRTPQKAIGFTIATAAVIALAGCVQNPTHVIPTADPTVAPVFASDADALAAAKKTYQKYLVASDDVAHDGGVHVERVAAFETSAEYADDVKTFAMMQSEGRHTVGQSTYRDFRLQSSTVTPAGEARVIAYLCFDISQTKLVDKSGADVGASRPLLLPLVVTFASAPGKPRSLLIERSITWSGTNFC